MRLYVSNLVHGVLNGIEFEVIFNFFISYSFAEISQVEVQHQHIGHQPMISQKRSRYKKVYLEPHRPNLKHIIP